VKDGRIVGVRGRAVDRVNHGRLGPKDLLDLAERCHPQTLRVSRWAEAKLKESSPQVLAS
jgi:hypothetical protein